MIKQLNANPEWVAAKRARDAERAALQAKHLTAVSGLERELKDAGIEMKSYRHLIYKPKNYKVGIPILIQHMRAEHYSDWERNSMAQAIAMKEANPYWNELLDLFRSVAGKEEHYSFEQGLAVALAGSYKHPEFPVLIELCETESLGYVRALLVAALKKSRDPRAEVSMMKLCSDPYLGKEMTKWMKKREKRRNEEGRNNPNSFN